MKKALWILIGMMLGMRLFGADSGHFSFQELPFPSLPSQLENHPASGRSGAFFGVHESVLILAGGSHSSGEIHSEGKEQFSAAIFLHTEPKNSEQEWQLSSGEVLPFPVAHGMSVSLPEGLLCIGGLTPDSLTKKVGLLTWESSAAQTQYTDWPGLPEALAYGGAALVGDWVIVAGGKDAAGTPQKKCWGLDLRQKSQPEFAWQELPSWPGPARFLPQVCSQHDGKSQKLFLMGGARYNAEGRFIPLNDAYAFDPTTQSWSELPEIRDSQGQARSWLGAPVLPWGAHHILFLGGTDGSFLQQLGDFESQISRLKARVDSLPEGQERQAALKLLQLKKATKVRLSRDFTGFSREILAYHAVTQTWQRIALMDQPGRIHTHAVRVGNRFFVASGEIGPGKQIPSVLAFGQGEFCGLSLLDYLVIGVYLLLVAGLGIWFFRRGKNTDDYFRAGGRIPAWAAGLSLLGTGLSALPYLSIPARTFGSDWLFLPYVLSLILVLPIVVFLVIPIYRRLKVISIYEYLERRFSYTIRLIGTATFVLFQVGRMGIMIFLPALAVATVTGLDVYACMLVIGGISVLYTVIGGMEGVIWTDVFQVVLLLGGALVMLVLLAGETPGGMVRLVDLAGSAGKLNTFDFELSLLKPVFWVTALGGVAAHLVTHTADQSLVQRYLSTKNEKVAKRSAWIFAGLYLPTLILLFFLGSALFTFYQSHPADLSPAFEEPEALLPWFLTTQFPPGVVGILIAGIFAASMSSFDSSLHSVSTVITSDFYPRFSSGNPNRLRFAKWTTLIVGIIGIGTALFMAGWGIKPFWEEFLSLMGFLVGGLGGLFLLGMLSQKAHTSGALIGFLFSGLLQFLISQSGTVHFLLYSFIGMISCLLVGYLASWALPGKPKDLRGLTLFSMRK